MLLHELDGEVFLAALAREPRLWPWRCSAELATRLRAATSDLRSLRRRYQPRSTRRPPSPATTVERPSEFDPRAAATSRTLPSISPRSAGAGGRALVRAINSLVVTRYEDVHRLSRPVRCSDRSRRSRPPTAPVRVARCAGHSPDTDDDPQDGDDHIRLRRLVAKVFTPRAVSSGRTGRLDRRAAPRRGGRQGTDRRDDRVRAAASGPDHLRDARHARRRPPTLRDVVPHAHQRARPVAHAGGGRRGHRRRAGDVRLRRRRSSPTSARHPGDDILTALIQAEEAGDRSTTTRSRPR